MLRASAAAQILGILCGVSAAAEVRLRSSAVAAGSVVRLADVAEILGDDLRLCDALADIPLCPAPGAGQSRTLTQHDVRQLLALTGVELTQSLVTGSDATCVSAGGSVSAAAPAKRPLAAAGMRPAVFEIDEPGATKQLPKPAAAKPVERAVTEAKSPATLLVERGASITVQAKTAGIRITTTGKALDAGTAGATIAVELSDTKQPVLARVIGPKTVEVTAATASGAFPAAGSLPAATLAAP